jgi:hypothetical protein
MALYGGAKYNAGYMGYMRATNQASQLCPITQITDPALQTMSGATLIGPGGQPSYQINENQGFVDTIGSGRSEGQYPGRRECQFGQRIEVADATFLTLGLRSHTVPGTRATGFVNGLQLFTAEFGVASDYADTSWAMQGIDCLMNSVRMEFAENQAATAQVDVWPICLLEQTSPAAKGLPTYRVPITWQTISWMVGGVDYKPLLAGLSVGWQNGLQRVGVRNVLGTGGVEYAISRTCNEIIPGLEVLQMQARLHGRLPAGGLAAVGSGIGAFTIYGEVPGFGAGRPCVTIVITYNYLRTVGGQEAQANAVLGFTADYAARYIAVTPGLTT